MSVAKGFDSALEARAAIRFPSTYTDADEMPESTTWGKEEEEVHEGQQSYNGVLAYGS